MIFATSLTGFRPAARMDKAASLLPPSLFRQLVVTSRDRSYEHLAAGRAAAAFIHGGHGGGAGTL